jgi:hypothetical protein
MGAGAVITVLTWLWKQPGGRTTFTATHVNIWAAMIRRHCTLDIRLACVTDMPDGIDPSIRIIRPPGEWEDLQTSRWKGTRPSCYRRIAMFRRGAGRIFGRRFVCMDLDCVIGGNIDRILSRNEDFVICSPSQQGPRYLYNGSMILMTAGARPQVYDRFNPEEAEVASKRFVGSDQAWIGHILGEGEAMFKPPDVVRWGREREGRIMFFPGNVKPWDVIADPFVGKHYRLSENRSALVLGRRSSVWEEAQAAMKAQAFDGVIAFTQTADHWPGRVDAIADNMPHAKRLASMLGFDRLTFCGV